MISVNQSIGNGKGIGLASLVSAYFELLEHYYSGMLIDELELKHLKKEMIVNQLEVLKEIKPFEILIKSNLELVKCIEFKSIDSDDKIYYPVELIQPQNVEVINEFSIYSSNNGTAIGCTFYEAIIHGICEVVERDSLSILYLRLLNSLALKQVNKTSLPIYLKCLISDFEAKIKGQIQIIDMTTEIDIPTYITFYSTDELPIIGCGCSISRETAIKRSVLECIQSTHLYNDEIQMEDHLVLKKFRSNKKLIDSLKLNYCDFETVDFLSTNNELFKPNEIYDSITRKLNNIGFEIYYRTIHENENLCCLQVIVPGLENFQMIKTGLPVLPGKRGIESIKKELLNDLHNR